jgi:arginine/lysine/ornithine decarboxylase
VAERYVVTHTFYSVNGASALLIAGMLAVIKPGDKVLLPRNVHRAIISGMILTGAEPVWVMPPWDPVWGIWGSISVDSIKAQLELDPDIKALVVTSPTYEGIGSDIFGLSNLCRQHQVYLIVDEAHGSLWPFCEALPESAIRQGSDIVVQSLHKTAGSLTQTALGHLPQESGVDPVVFQEALNTVQTTSPSYLLLASLESAALMLTKPEAQEKLLSFVDGVQHFRERFSSTIKGFKLFRSDAAHDINHLYCFDSTRLLIRHPQWAGQDWAVCLEADKGLAYESSSQYHSLYIAQWGLEPKDFEGFYLVFDQAQSLAPNQLASQELHAKLARDYPPLPLPQIALSPRDAFFSPAQTVYKIGRAHV